MSTPSFPLSVRFGRGALNSGTKRLAELYLGRPFLGTKDRRLAIYYLPTRISFSQVYPFLVYEKRIQERFGTQVRLFPIDRLAEREASKRVKDDIIAVQTWFTIAEEELHALMRTVQSKNPEAVIAYLDSFAPSDLRLAKVVDPYVTFYLTKSLFRDETSYFTPFRGDTNLTDYYGRLYGTEAEPVDWAVPQTILPKLRLSPHFFTAPKLLEVFLNRAAPGGPWRNRSIDVHARLATQEDGWYGRMRTAALQKVEGLSGRRVVTETGIPWKQYMAEMADSKLCFSPFGYGELCWRDVEAIAAGAVLVKPHMDHLRTEPDLFRPHETYIPVAWDFSDLLEVLERYLDDSARCEALAETAFQTIHDYLRRDGFLDQMESLFAV